jgi:microsomal dipeptidase-like Zn-dependent dipeptidase
MSDTSDAIARLHREAPLTDVHAHPALKAYLFRRNLWRHYRSGSVFSPFASRTDFNRLERGGVGVVWSANYIPERELFENCFLLRLVSALLLPAYRKITTGSLFDRLLEMMDAMELEIDRRPDRTELAKSVADLRRIREAGKIAIVHTLEGAHPLDGDPDRLEVLASRGVAMITLAHFYDNGLVAHVDGVPRDLLVRHVCNFDFGDGGTPALTDLGRAVLRRMAELRMVVDVTHCTPAAREEIYAEMGRERPIVASHVGVARFRDDPYNLTDDEIREIAATGGAVGVIFLTYWLSAEHPGDGLPAIWRTLEHVHDLTGSWDHVMLGTDFDGFTDPPDDVRDASELGAVTRMLLERGVSEVDVMKILGGNAMRVLQRGWR